MPFKYIVPTIDEAPEPVRPFYVERDGKFVFDVEGVVPEEQFKAEQAKTNTFRENNRVLLSAFGAEGLSGPDLLKQVKDLVSLRDLRTRYEGVDPDEYKALKADKDKLTKRGVKDADDIEALILKATEKALAPIRQELETEKQARTSAQKAADAARFRELITADATKAGVRAQSLRHVLREADEQFELRDSALVSRNGHEQTPALWLQELARTDDYLFEGSSGGGASNTKGGAKPGVRRLINPSPEEMGRHMDDIASGKIEVVRQ